MSPRKDPRDGLLPSVTTILKMYGKPDLQRWYAWEVAKAAVLEQAGWRDLPTAKDAIEWLRDAPTRTRDKAADHGTKVHEKADALHKGGESTGSLEEEIEQDFLRLYGFNVTYSEFSVISRFGYGGAGDLMGDMWCPMHNETDTWLVDRKTSKNPHEDWALQQAAYRFSDLIVDTKPKSLYQQHWYDPNADVLAQMPNVDHVGILLIPRDEPENWRLIELQAERAEFETFLAVKRVYDWAREAKKREPGEVPAKSTEAAA